MQKVGLVVNPQKKGAKELARKLSSWLREKKKTVFQSATGNLTSVIGRSDLLVCLGGDGTILNVASYMTKRSIPVLGVNMGSLGFLTAVRTNEVFHELESILKGSYKVDKRIMMRARAGGSKASYQALNDVVINREGLARYLRIRVKAGGEDLMSFSGDGVIVATPTGSTAYSFSAGGPCIYPSLDSVVVTPICAHALLTRPIVLPTEKEIRITFEADKGAGKASCTMDGQKKIAVSSRQVIEITKAPMPFKLIASSKRSYLDTLREKFGMALNA